MTWPRSSRMCSSDLSWRNCNISDWMLLTWFLYCRSPKGEGGILFYLCPTVRPSKIFFVALFSVTVDGRDLIFGHKFHIGTPYRGKHFWTHQIPTSCLPTLLIFIHIEHICSFFITFFSATIEQESDIGSQASYRYAILWEVVLDPSDSYFLFADLVGFYTHWAYMHIFRHIFLINYWWQKSDIWSQASYRYPISWKAFLDPSDSYFLFADFVDFYTHWTYMLIFHHIFLSNYWWQKSDIWSQASYRYPISWEAFLDPSDSYFLFGEERWYHKWALAHSSSCFI